MTALWAPVAVTMCLLYLVSAQSGMPRVAHGWDKVLHVGAYGFLGVLSLRAFHGGLGRLRRAPTILGFLLTAGYGLVDEWHQIWVPGRHAAASDWVADVAGALGAIAFVGLLATLRSRGEGSGSLGNLR